MVTTPVKVLTIQKQGAMGDMRYVIFDLAISTYATNGAGLTAAELGLKDIIRIPFAIATGGTLQPNTFTYDYANAVVMSWSYPAAQALETTDNSDAGKAYRMIAFGH
jgi:hypothetical protein